MISVYLYLKVHGKSLDQFTYSDSDINRVILSCMANTSIDGISGSLHFEQGADPTKDVKIQRIEGENLEIQINYNNYFGITELKHVYQQIVNDICRSMLDLMPNQVTSCVPLFFAKCVKRKSK